MMVAAAKVVMMVVAMVVDDGGGGEGGDDGGGDGGGSADDELDCGAAEEEEEDAADSSPVGASALACSAGGGVGVEPASVAGISGSAPEDMIDSEEADAAVVACSSTEVAGSANGGRASGVSTTGGSFSTGGEGVGALERGGGGTITPCSSSPTYQFRATCSGSTRIVRELRGVPSLRKKTISPFKVVTTISLRPSPLTSSSRGLV